MTNTPSPQSTGGTGSPLHHVVVVTLGEVIGVSVLAIFADMSDDLGKVAVALMAGWFLVFLISNPSLQAVFSHIHSSQSQGTVA